MRQKRFLVLSLVLGSALLITTAFASATSVWTTDSMLVKKVATVGTNSNKGQLLVKGFIRNPVKGKKVYVKDHLKVQGNVQVGGILQGNNIVSADNLGTGVVTETKLGTGAVTADKLGTGAVTTDKLGTGAVSSAKIADDAVNADKLDFSIDGVVKAAAYGTQATCNSTALARSFNKLASSSATCSRTSTGIYTVNFNTTISSRFFQVTPLHTSDIYPVINSLPSSTIEIYFYDAAGATADLTDPTGFYITVY